MKVTVIPDGIGALGTIPKGLLKELIGLEIRGNPKTALLKLARIQLRILVIWGDLLLIKLQEKTISKR